MEINGQVKAIADRLAASGLDGEPLSLLTGKETLEELRALVFQLSKGCPNQQKHVPCPFAMLASLTHASLTSLVKNLSHQACVDLFQLELTCRSQTNFTCCLSQKTEGRREASPGL